MIKAFLQRALRALGLYVWFKEESFAYDVYRYFKDGRPVTWRRREQDFYRNLLGVRPEGLLIFDVGANRGQRTDVFLGLGARVVAVEPDETNRRLLARKYTGRFRRRPVMIEGRAASDSERVETLWITSPGSGLNTLSEKWVRTLRDNPRKFGARVGYADRRAVETTTLAALVKAHGSPHYIKIDVEGHEVSVLRGLATPVPLVSFEANLPEFLPEAAECVRILDQLSPKGAFNMTPSDGYKGFQLGEWQTPEGIILKLDTLGETTVEIYWSRGD